MTQKITDKTKNTLKVIDKNVRDAFCKIKDEMEVHLDSINANTQEINANYEHILKVESRMDKLEEKIDNIHMLVSNLLKESNTFNENDYAGTALSVREQEVFLVLYTATGNITYSEVAKKLALTNEIVERTIDNLIAKKVPVQKIFENNALFVILDDNFKNFQTRKNVLNINEHVSKSVITN